MPPKRQASIKASQSLGKAKRRQQPAVKPKPTATASPNRSPKAQARIAKVAEKRSLTDLEKEEIIRELRDFDLNSKFGPCVGISRIERWERAKVYNKAPPVRVGELLVDEWLQEQLGESLTENLWHKIL